ncbi:MAG: peptidoglycan-associated lipoprotein [Candidatus Rokuibacteriota bacterium]|nr:MAG: peptidoglycan-associated lipoprotein [Candidatus Rokubacteria bacterium]
MSERGKKPATTKQRRNRMIFGSRVLRFSACLLLLGLVACDKGPSAPSSQARPAASGMVASAAPATTPSAKDFAPATSLTPLHFAFDKHEVLAGDRGALDQTARWLKARPEMMVQIAGHGDERGTDAYNLALGERRAHSIRIALTKLGVDSRRLTTTSYGENRPLCSVHTEDCWAKNRRAEFLVKPQ